MAIDTGDLTPRVSGAASLGVEQIGLCGFTSDIRPFCHVHMNSGVWHDPFYGQSGVLRYSQAAGCFEVSVDGGTNFDCLLTSQSGVLGVNGVDVLQVGGNFVVDAAAVSGLIPSVASGVAVCRAADFTDQTAITLQHNLDTENLIVQVHDDAGEVVIPDSVTLTDNNSVDVTFNRQRSGRVVAIGCTSGVGMIPAEERKGFKQGMNPFTLGGSGIQIPPGRIHYVDFGGTHRILELNSEVEIGQQAVSKGQLVPQDWYYVYVHASGTSNNIGSGNFDYETVEPVFDSTKFGWYDPSPGNARRCIGAIQARNINFFRSCEVQGLEHRYRASFTILINSVSNYTTQDVSCGMPVYSNMACIYVQCEAIGGTTSVTNLNWTDADFDAGGNDVRLLRVHPPGTVNVGFGDTQVDGTIAGSIHVNVPVNPDTKRGRITANTNNSLVLARQHGHIVPTFIGDTPG